MRNRVKLDQDYPVITESERWHARAAGLSPAFTQTLAKGPGQHVRGVSPMYVSRGKGARLWDVDGNEYVDLQMAIGPLVLGYGDPIVDDAIHAQIEDGITFSLVHPLEVEVAERVRALVPGTEMVRFSKTGCDVTSAAVRLARAYTKRDRVLCCGYHGWHDWYIGVTDRHAGIPEAVRELTSTFPYGDVASVVEAIDDETACVILEPMVFEAPPAGFLEELRRACDRRGVVLIFDEMWTGFRLALGGAQERFGVRADLACFSKAIANGMPLSALTGRAEIMRLLERDVFFFTTFGGEALSLAAARATLDALVLRDVPAVIREKGRRLRDGYNALAREIGLEFTSAIGDDCRSLVTFSATGVAAKEDPLVLRSFVQQEMLRHGVLFGGFHNVSYALADEDVAHVLAAYARVLPALGDAVVRGETRSKLRGAPVEPVFRRTSNFDTRPRRKP